MERQVHPLSNTHAGIAQHRFGHVVQFYQGDESLLAPLSTFLTTGIRNGDLCLVIGTATHAHKIEERLQRHGITTSVLRAQGHYLHLEVDALLSECTAADGRPHEERLLQLLYKYIPATPTTMQRMRIFEEMGARVWRTGDREGVLRIEHVWEKLSRKSDLSVMCAYPELHFIMHQEMISDISHHHDRIIATNATIVPQYVSLA